VDAFGKLMEAIGHRPTQHEVIYDDTPIELHATDIVDRLGREGPLTFENIFEGRSLRSEIVGLFLALLELVRQKKVRAMQDANFGRITVGLCPPAGETAAAPGPETHVAPPAEDQGRYVADQNNGREEELDGVG
jgi:hypothetical protein